MKKVTTFAAMFAIILASCTQQANNQNEQTTQESLRPAETVVAAEEITSVLSGYMAIKDALVATDAQKASKSANALLALLTEENEMMGKLKESVQKIAVSEDTDQQRAAFELLSEDVYTYVKENDLERGTLYRQYCPMAFKNKGAYWLSTSNQVRNPYFGDRMLKCGSVRETLE